MQALEHVKSLVRVKMSQFDMYEIFMAQETNDENNILTFGPATLHPLKKRDPIPADIQPTFEMDRETIQRLMNQFWKLGFRPESDMGDFQEHIQALKAHIKDLNRITEHHVEIIKDHLHGKKEEFELD